MAHNNPMHLADLLDSLRGWPPNTATLSAADEASLAFVGLSPELDEAQRAFQKARWAHKDADCGRPTRTVDETWGEAVDAGMRLAGLLRALGPPLIEVPR